MAWPRHHHHEWRGGYLDTSTSYTLTDGWWERFDLSWSVGICRKEPRHPLPCVLLQGGFAQQGIDRFSLWTFVVFVMR
jgi:hypothetical protein